MEDALKQLENEYKEKRKNISSIGEYIELKKDYKEMKSKLQKANKIIKENDLDSSFDWDMFDFPELPDVPDIKEIEKNSIYYKAESSLYGFFVGDALGVPVEFVDRDSLKKNPVTIMLEYGTHNQPKGTWSDDSSMTLATMNGLIAKHQIDYIKIMDNFVEWYRNAKFTPFNKVFDIGNTTSYSINKYQSNRNQNILDINCGSNDVYSNGNGSLMRITPIVFFTYRNVYFDNKTDNILNNNLYDCIKKVSSMTHAHDISIIGCYIYTIYMYELLNGNDKFEAYKILKEKFNNVLDNEYIKVYSRILKLDISKLSEDEIKSSGYIVDTLEASLWCVLTTDSYKEAILKAVNLGNDTDTIGAITGSIAGLIYGKENIPSDWLNDLQGKEYLDDEVMLFTGTLCSNSMKSNSNNVESELNININNNTLNTDELLNKIDNKIEELENFSSNEKIYKQLVLETIEDLKNNVNCCTKDDNPFSDSKLDETLKAFIHYLYENELLDQNYLENIKIVEKKEIEELTQEEVLTYLTFIIRADRFSPGTIYNNVKNGKLLTLLERLNYIIKNN